MRVVFAYPLLLVVASTMKWIGLLVQNVLVALGWFWLVTLWVNWRIHCVHNVSGLQCFRCSWLILAGHSVGQLENALRPQCIRSAMYSLLLVDPGY